MKFVIPPSMADAFRRDDGTLPDNVEVMDRVACSTTIEAVRLRAINPPEVPQLAMSPTPATFKGKRVAQWKQERRGAR